MLFKIHWKPCKYNPECTSLAKMCNRKAPERQPKGSIEILGKDQCCTNREL